MKRCFFPKATLTTLPARTILALMQHFYQAHPLPKTRGRPRQYPEALILTLALLQVRDRASWRQLRYALALETLPNHALPALSTLVYRIHTIPETRWHPLLEWLAQQGLSLEAPMTERPYAMVDGTGVGYATPFYAQFRRGAEIRRLRSHVKAVVVGYWQGNRVWLMGAALGQAYADEGKLLGKWVATHERGGLPQGTLVVGDALYGYRARLLELLEQAGWSPVARVSDGVWQRARASSRLRARAEAHPAVLRGRYRIEQVFGSVKEAYRSYVEARSLRGARCWVWRMGVLWNLVGLVRVGGDWVFLCVLAWLPRFFEHPPLSLDFYGDRLGIITRQNSNDVSG